MARSKLDSVAGAAADGAWWSRKRAGEAVCRGWRGTRSISGRDDLLSSGPRRPLGHPANRCSPRTSPSLQGPSCSPSALQLGNYLGALSNWVRLQQNARPDDTLLYMVVGWHALTLPQNPKELESSRWDMLATLLAVGLDPKRSVIFHQDDVRPSRTLHLFSR
jgi:hypothetical protein